MSTKEDRLRRAQRVIDFQHRRGIEEYRHAFEGAVPTDEHTWWVYNYGDAVGSIYIGMTGNAPDRARKHRKLAPWATWVRSVDYIRCENRASAYALETELIRELQPLCAIRPGSGRVRHHHGEDWSDIDEGAKINHVTGHCQLPGGICDPVTWEQEVGRLFPLHLDGLTSAQRASRDR